METTIHPRSGPATTQPGTDPANPAPNSQPALQSGTTQPDTVLQNPPAPAPADDPARPATDPPPEPDPLLPVKISGKLCATTECADALEGYDIRSDEAPPDWQYDDLAFRSTGRF